MIGRKKNGKFTINLNELVNNKSVLKGEILLDVYGKNGQVIRLGTISNTESEFTCVMDLHKLGELILK